jgi:hypothetical protein
MLTGWQRRAQVGDSYSVVGALVMVRRGLVGVTLSGRHTRAFRRYPICRGSTGQKWFVLRHTTKHTHRPLQPWQQPVEMAPYRPKL